MATFDPNKNYGDGAIPSGTYLLAMVGFDRKESKQKRGSFYMRARFRVIAGPKKGATFFSSVGIDVRNAGTAARLSLYCKAAGVTEAFDLDDDEAFADAFKGKPFKAVVKTTQNGAYTNNDIERYVLDLTHEESDLCDEWWEKWLAKSDAANDPQADDEWSPDDYAEATQSTGAGRSRAHDDDIPF